ncbi:hypothetical protein G6F35_015819 [Rhizopus arrhizus]|nr:hypothetical protein G6F35_015819 [Rhizopus arrhizus]
MRGRPLIQAGAVLHLEAQRQGDGAPRQRGLPHVADREDAADRVVAFFGPDHVFGKQREQCLEFAGQQGVAVRAQDAFDIRGAHGGAACGGARGLGGGRVAVHELQHGGGHKVAVVVHADHVIAVVQQYQLAARDGLMQQLRRAHGPGRLRARRPAAPSGSGSSRPAQTWP